MVLGIGLEGYGLHPMTGHVSADDLPSLHGSERSGVERLLKCTAVRRQSDVNQTSDYYYYTSALMELKGEKV